MEELKTSDYDFELPESQIAQHPEDKRDHSRLMVLNRQTGGIEDRHFYDLLDYLKPGDVMVINDTKVIPARIHGRRETTGAKIELLLLENTGGDIWECMAKPARRVRPGETIVFSDKLKAHVLGRGEEGLRTVRFEYDGVFEEVLSEIGEMPLPPYIHERLEEPGRYQTVYATYDGSAAAPTAGLHFTPELMEKIKEKGVEVAPVTLHVGLGTFRPVKEENLANHKMHSERFFIPERTAEIVNAAKEEGRRVVAVGTTSVRALESVADERGRIKSGSGDTEIFIYPGVPIKVADALITNFHLPKSTLLMLVSAFYNKEAILEAYAYAVKEGYRFFSFGDAMLIE